MQESTKRSFWNFGIGGLIGAAIAGFGTYFTQQQVSLAENQYFMELDKLRLAIMIEETEEFEKQLKELNALGEVRDKGYRPVFEQTLADDIAEVEGRIARVAQARADAAASDAAEAEAKARRQEAADAAAAAQARKEQTLRTNPSFFLDCGGSTGRYCP